MARRSLLDEQIIAEWEAVRRRFGIDREEPPSSLEDLSSTLETPRANEVKAEKPTQAGRHLAVLRALILRKSREPNKV